MDTLGLSLELVKIGLILFTIVNVVPIMSWVERRGAALIQDRPGPNRVGPFGLLQPISDFIKFLWKEDPIPVGVNKALYAAAPFMALLPACLVVAALPMGDYIEILGHRLQLQIADLNVGVLYFMAIGSMGVYGILFGGWASNSKFSLMGSMRSSSQILSYEIPLGLAAVGAVLYYGSFNLREMTLMQDGTFFGFLPRWGVFVQPLGFLLFFIASFAETNRLPFDLPETEAELVAGYHTEYGSMKFATFMMAEYMNLASISGLMICLYFGGWHLPWISDAWLVETLGSRTLVGLIQFLTFNAKIYLFMFVFVWVRWTVPRFRFDQLMDLAWKTLIPMGLINLVLTAVGLYWWVGR